MTANNDINAQDRGSLVLGTILSVPLFLVSFLVVAVVYYVFHTFMAGSVTDVAIVVNPYSARAK